MRTAAKNLAWHNRYSRPLGALFFLALFLALQLFASSGTLHRVLHAAAHAPDHHCLITVLTQGQVNVPVVTDVWLALAAALIFFLPLLQTTVFCPPDLRLSPGRSPPRF